MKIVYFVALLCLLVPAATLGAAQPVFEMQEIEKELGVGYAVSLADVNADKKTDIVIVDTDRVIWYENPSWKQHTLIEGQTKKDNVCIAPYDIDGDGKLDFALGADWRPSDTVGSGSIQWFTQPERDEAKGTVYPISTQPTVHRMRWADMDGDGKSELYVLPLHGRGTSGPNHDQRALRFLQFHIPENPRKDEWKKDVVNEDLHVAHNFWPTDLDGDGRLDMLVVSFEGVSLIQRSPGGEWSRKLIGEGNQQTSPNRGASEIKHGKLAGGKSYIATIEPWHGFQTVVYLPPKEEGQLWRRNMIDDKLAWGHAVWCANIDDDEDEELIIGGRDEKEGIQRGVRIYDPQDGGEKWTRHFLDPGGVAVEDLAAADLDGDGRVDIVAAGRQTKNVRIYWNKEKATADERR